MNPIKIAMLECPGDGGVEASLERAAEMIAEGCYDRPDVFCLPEIFAWKDVSAEQRMVTAEPVGGRVTTAMAELAREHKVNILTALIERDGDRVYNSAVWLDRQGEVIGTYRKVFPTDYEMADGIHPGSLDFKVFDTEFGPVACCICFDLNFREVIERIAEQDAKLVLFPSRFHGLTLMQAWGKLYRMYFASCPDGAVANPLGEALRRSMPCSST